MNKISRIALILSTLLLSIIYTYNSLKPYKGYISYTSSETQIKVNDIKPKTEETPIKILFVGDIMLDRNVAREIRKQGFISLFSDVKEIFENKDLIIGNLEGTLTDNKSIAEIDHNILRFTFNPSYAKELKNLGFSGFSLANNHSSDFYSEGYNQTKTKLNDASLFSFGSSRNDTEIYSIYNHKGKNLCFIGYHDLYTYDESPVVDEIINLRPSCDHITVFAHWGNEYETTQSTRQTTLAHSFIDSGADLVIGAHPHVVQPIEIYKNKAIFYSLGNFIFDQDFSFNTKHGIAINVDIYKDKTEFKIIPISINKSKLSLSDADEQDKILNIIKNKEFSIINN